MQDLTRAYLAAHVSTFPRITRMRARIDAVCRDMAYFLGDAAPTSDLQRYAMHARCHFVETMLCADVDGIFIPAALRNDAHAMIITPRTQRAWLREVGCTNSEDMAKVQTAMRGAGHDRIACDIFTLGGTCECKTRARIAQRAFDFVDDRGGDPCPICWEHEFDVSTEVHGGRSCRCARFVALPRCDHAFHVGCLLHTISTASVCPLCRRDTFDA